MIQTTGPIPIGTYMRECLTHSSTGYYINRDPFGKSGDFITSPEISQMFGELVAIWVLTQWMAQGSPSKFRLVEFGPGRGTLMEDFLRAMKRFEPFYNALQEIHMIEASPVLQEIQKFKLQHTIKPIQWHKDLLECSVEDIPTFFIAHEFFDALPIYQFQNTSEGWREYLIDSVKKPQDGIINIKSVSPESKAAFIGSKKYINDEFKIVLAKSWTKNSQVMPKTSPRYSKLPVGSKIEICPELWQISQTLADSIGRFGGAALIVDYGPADATPTNTLRGIRNHKWVSPLIDPGETDLSADVDFLAIRDAAETYTNEVTCYGPVEQGDWLHSLGITARAEMLSKNKTHEKKEEIKSAYRRLVEKATGSMGGIYKVATIVPAKSPVPVGFGGKVDSS